LRNYATEAISYRVHNTKTHQLVGTDSEKSKNLLAVAKKEKYFGHIMLRKGKNMKKQINSSHNTGSIKEKKI